MARSPLRPAAPPGAMPSGAAAAAAARAPAASCPRRHARRLVSCEAPRVAPGRGGGTWKSDSGDARAATRVTALGVSVGGPRSGDRAPPARARWGTRARGAKQSDWDLMDEELRGMRAASGGATALGVDYGMNRTGIAVSAGGIAPRPLEVVASKPIDALVREVVHRAIKERVDVIVVGLPVPPNMTAAQAASARASRRSLKKKSAEEKVPIQSSSDGERLRARVDVATLASRRFRDASDLESWLGADGLKRELAKHRMKAGGTPRECSERLFSLIARRGVLNDVPARFFPGNARGKREAVRFAMEKQRTIHRDDGVREDVTVLSEAGARKQKEKKKNSRPPREMHVLCRRFAERVADAAAALDVPIPVELYDESRTSLQAGLAVEASRGARGAAASLRPEASLDDVAAALLLERYFRKDRGPALPVKPIRGSRVLKAEGGETEDATPTENGVEEGSS